MVKCCHKGNPRRDAAAPIRRDLRVSWIEVFEAIQSLQSLHDSMGPILRSTTTQLTARH